MKNYYLVPNDASWELKAEGGKVIGEYASKQEAVIDSRTFVEREHGSLKIHRADGTIEEERTYPKAEDPPEGEG
jgi:hypothetical protein